MRCKIITLFIFFIIPMGAFTQSLSFKIGWLRTSYNELKENSGSSDKQLAYIQNFPSDSTSFMDIFQPADYKHLYKESHDYINTFFSLSTNHPNEIIDKSINIGEYLIWQGDATGDMQHGIVDLGNSNTKIFASKLHSLTQSHKAHLISFLADVENFTAYPQYQSLINSLNKIGEKTLADEFVNARTLRESEKNH
jgi:hypothetical protein